MIGKTLGQYRMLAEMGKGLIGETFLAEQLPMGIRAAVKVIHPELTASQEFMERFRYRVAEATSVSHGSIVRIQRIGVQQEVYYLISDFVPGPKGKPLDAEKMLKMAVSRGGQLPEKTVWRWTRDMIKGLHYAHSLQKPLIHGDLKPSNLVVNEDGHVLIADFGLAQAIPVGLWDKVARDGTARDFRAPEQRAGREPVIASDIYSLGAVVHYLLTGINPNVSRTEVRHLRPGVVPEWEEIIETCMDPEPARRYGSAIDILEHLPSVDQGGAGAALRTELPKASPIPAKTETAEMTGDRPSASPVTTPSPGDSPSPEKFPSAKPPLPALKPKKRLGLLIGLLLGGAILAICGIVFQDHLSGKKNSSGEGGISPEERTDVVDHAVTSPTWASLRDFDEPGGTPIPTVLPRELEPPRIPGRYSGLPMPILDRNGFLNWDLSAGRPGYHANRLRIEFFTGERGEAGNLLGVALLPMGTAGIRILDLSDRIPLEEMENRLVAWRVCFAADGIPASESGDPYFGSGFFRMDDRPDGFAGRIAEKFTLSVLPEPEGLSPEGDSVINEERARFSWPILEPPNPGQEVEYRLHLERKDREEHIERTVRGGDIQTPAPGIDRESLAGESLSEATGENLALSSDGEWLYTIHETFSIPSNWEIHLTASAVGGRWDREIPLLQAKSLHLAVSTREAIPYARLEGPADGGIIHSLEDKIEFSWTIPALAHMESPIAVDFLLGVPDSEDGISGWILQRRVPASQHDSEGRGSISLSDLIPDRGDPFSFFEEDSWYLWTIRTWTETGVSREAMPRRIGIDLRDDGPVLDLEGLKDWAGRTVAGALLDQAHVRVVRDDPDLHPARAQDWFIRFHPENRIDSATLISIPEKGGTIPLGTEIRKVFEASREELGAANPYEHSPIVVELVRMEGDEMIAPGPPLVRFRIGKADAATLGEHHPRPIRKGISGSDSCDREGEASLLCWDSLLTWSAPRLLGLDEKKTILYKMEAYLGGGDRISLLDRREYSLVQGATAAYEARFLPGLPLDADLSVEFRLFGRLDGVSPWLELARLDCIMSDPLFIAPQLPIRQSVRFLDGDGVVSWRDTGRERYTIYLLSQEGSVLAGPFEFRQWERSPSEDPCRVMLSLPAASLRRLISPSLLEALGTGKRYRLLLTAIVLPSPESRIARLRQDAERWSDLAPEFLLEW